MNYLYQRLFYSQKTSLKNIFRYLLRPDDIFQINLALNLNQFHFGTIY